MEYLFLCVQLEGHDQTWEQENCTEGAGEAIVTCEWVAGSGAG